MRPILQRAAPDIAFDIRPFRMAPVHWDSHHDLMLADIGAIEAGMRAEQEGYDAVAIETVTRLRDLLAGAVLIDLGNPLDPPHWESRLAGGPSLAERIAEAAPRARVVKAFNTVYAELLALPAPEGAPAPQTFVASDDDAAKSLVIDLARAIGTDPVDAGPLRMSRHLEAVAGFEVALTARGFADAVATRVSPG